jgi:predicted GNAT superfamily acetyltransferase
MTTLVAEADRPAVLTARADAAAAAAASGVVIEQVGDVAGRAAIGAVVDAVWHPAPGGEPLTPSILRAFEHTGSYCAVARLDADVVGACVGFLAVEPAGCLHSHLAGVTMAGAGRHVGFALKLDQRAWALEHGLGTVEWTFDPLVRRNAYFNCVKLAARPTAYLTDFYGEMQDRTNAGQGSDRLVATWSLLDPRVSAAAAGDPRIDRGADLHGRPDVVLALGVDGDQPVPGGQPAVDTAVVLAAIPEDIGAIRLLDPGLALRWRHALRETLTCLLATGWAINGMTRDGYYLLRRSLELSPARPDRIRPDQRRSNP